MCRVNIDGSTAFGIDPTLAATAAREHKGVHLIAFQNGETQIAVGRGYPD
jgi:hypothetical protein